MIFEIICIFLVHFISLVISFLIVLDGANHVMDIIFFATYRRQLLNPKTQELRPNMLNKLSQAQRGAQLGDSNESNLLAVRGCARCPMGARYRS